MFAELHIPENRDNRDQGPLCTLLDAESHQLTHVHATRVVCCPPHASLTSDYIVWIILTLCEVPGLLAGWAFAIVMWVNSPGVRYDDPGLAGETIGFTVPLIALVTSFLVVTATLTHSFRPKNESVTEVWSEDSLRMALLNY
jgi:hypothetical protein